MPSNRASGAARLRRYFLSNMAGTLVSRAFGFAREMVVGGAFGASQATDVFVVAFTIPTLFRRVLGEEMVERAFLPSFKALLEQGKRAEAWQLISRLGNLMLLALLIAMGLCYSFARPLVDLIAPGLDEESARIAVTLTYIVLPFMVFIGLYALLGGMLLFLGEVTAFAFSPIMLSVGVIGVVPFFADALGAQSLAAGFLVGGILQALFCVPFLFRKRLRQKYRPHYHFSVALSGPEIRVVGRESLWILLAAIAVKAVDIVDRILASHLPQGSISALYFADRLNDLPLAILGLTLARALLPPLTDAAARNDMADFVATLTKGLRYNALLVGPVSLLMIALSVPVVRIIYQRAAFDDADTRMTALALACYAVGLFGTTGYGLLTRSFSALISNRAAVLISLCGMVVIIALKALLVTTPLAHGGLALATSISFTGMTAVLLLAVRRAVRARGAEMPLAAIGRAIALALIAGGLAAVAAFGVWYGIDRLGLAPLRLRWLDLSALLGVAAGGLVGLAVYTAVLAALGVSEVRTAWSWVSKKLKR
ncbi:MAG: murein biosynthesis integral membrane protein MurJ [Deltaproteobacteria bacterium]|nr:murein biosynthesis integral membrane protein MurJ [Deltaproteobacteria bacterium]